MTVSVSCSRECGCARTRKSLSESAVYSGVPASFPKRKVGRGVVWCANPGRGKWKDTFATPFGVIPTSFGVIWNGVLWTFGV
eukprot:scaffold48949_cov66-Phaeocystis_antarctica.AAC.3